MRASRFFTVKGISRLVRVVFPLFLLALPVCFAARAGAAPEVFFTRTAARLETWFTAGSEEEPSSEAAPEPEPEKGVLPVLSVPGGEPATEPEPEAEQEPITPKAYSIRSEAIAITDKAGLSPDVSTLLAQGISLPVPDGPQVLILHTHGSEAYTPDGEDLYTPSDPMRTEDTDYNVIHVGDILTETLTDCGISVLHDRSLYDYPTYTGSYARAAEGISAFLSQYPTIQIVIDLHRDAVELSDGSEYATQCTIDGKTASQVMLVVGTDANGLEHPNWQENMKLALHLQCAMDSRYPGLSRPITLSPYRYNQHLTRGSLIAEVGYSGNTLQEAVTAARAFGLCLADVLISHG